MLIERLGCEANTHRCRVALEACEKAQPCADALHRGIVDISKTSREGEGLGRQALYTTFGMVQHVAMSRI